MTFPFEAVYKKTAHEIMTQGMPAEGIFEPRLIVARIVGNDVVLTEIPGAALFFSNAASKEALGMFIRAAMLRLELTRENAAFVLVSESYFLSRPLAPGQTFDDIKNDVPEGSLADHPDAISVIMVNIYRPEETRMGHLTILPDRKLKFNSMLTGKIAGRLSGNPD